MIVAVNLHQKAMQTLHSSQNTRKAIFFCNICPCDNNIVYARFEEVRMIYEYYSSFCVLRITCNVAKCIYVPVTIFSYRGLYFTQSQLILCNNSLENGISQNITVRNLILSVHTGINIFNNWFS